MKTTIALFCIIFCTNLVAQTNYYKKTQILNESGHLYQCDVATSQRVTLYDINNKLTYERQYDKTTGTIPSIEEFMKLDDTKNGIIMRKNAERIINRAFPIAEIDRLRGASFNVKLYISPETGKVMEVVFSFPTFNLFATVPLSTYIKIETELKNSLKYTPTEYGKNLNYIFRGWRHKLTFQ